MKHMSYHSVLIKHTTVPSASYPLVIQAFVPLSTQWSPSRVAVVDAAPASLPLPGSLSAKQPIFSPWRNGAMNWGFRSSVMYFWTGPRYKLWNITCLIVWQRNWPDIRIAYCPSVRACVRVWLFCPTSHAHSVKIRELSSCILFRSVV